MNRQSVIRISARWTSDVRISGLSVVVLLLSCTAIAHAAQTQLWCHRTANRDVPENTLDSLEQAALLGCNVVEVDVRRTLDGKLVLNHDGFMERLTDAAGEIETTDYDELRLYDAGSWMGDRFAGMRIPLFEDAVRLARARGIRLVLDMKDKGMGADVLAILRREGMLDRVRFGGEWDDVKSLYPAADSAEINSAWVLPGVTAEQVKTFHEQGKLVIANFGANEHEMDLAGMKSAVAAGVDAINVDLPRLGADAVGRPVEDRLHQLAAEADRGDSAARSKAILELARYRGFPLQELFARWLLDADTHVSRAAALALVLTRPSPAHEVFTPALRSKNSAPRVNAAWALGMLHAPAETVLPLLRDPEPTVVAETLLALSRMPGNVPARLLLPLLSHGEGPVRGAAAISLAIHDPRIASSAVPAQLHRDMAAERVVYDEHQRSGRKQYSQDEIDRIVIDYRCQMEMLRALHLLPSSGPNTELLAQAFASTPSFLELNSLVASYDLWDRIDARPAPAVQALQMTDPQAAGRAEWTLVKAGPSVLPAVRLALDSPDAAVRAGAMRILAWQGDTGSLERLRSLSNTPGPDRDLSAWAVAKIESLHPEPAHVPASEARAKN
jgi:glycerophosphoryl diester phosphodiesterase